MQYIYRCLICQQNGSAHKGFKAPAIEGIILGEHSDPRITKVFDGLLKHLQEKHPAEFAGNLVQGANYAAFLNYLAFELPDPRAFQHRDWMRACLASVTRRVQIPDDKITEQVQRLNLPGDCVEKVIMLIQQFRDVEEERGQFAPQAPVGASEMGEAQTPAPAPPLQIVR